MHQIAPYVGRGLLGLRTKPSDNAPSPPAKGDYRQGGPGWPHPKKEPEDERKQQIELSEQAEVPEMGEVREHVRIVERVYEQEVFHQHGEGWEKGKSEVNHVHQREQEKCEIVGRDDTEEAFLQKDAIAFEGAVVRPEVGTCQQEPRDDVEDDDAARRGEEYRVQQALQGVLRSNDDRLPKVMEKDPEHGKNADGVELWDGYPSGR